jgi:hypothetical protein
MAGDYFMCATLLRLSGAIVCDSFEEFESVLQLTSYMPCFMELRKKRRSILSENPFPNSEKVCVGMITNAGFEKCALADHLFFSTSSPSSSSSSSSSSSFVSLSLPNYSTQSSAQFTSYFKTCNLTEVIGFFFF